MRRSKASAHCTATRTCSAKDRDQKACQRHTINSFKVAKAQSKALKRVAGKHDRLHDLDDVHAVDDPFESSPVPGKGYVVVIWSVPKSEMSDSSRVGEK